MKATSSDRARHLLVSAEAGEALPQALTAALREAGVSSGWVRASGVLVELELQGESGTRKISGAVQAVAVEGSLRSGAVTLRGVFAREGDGGMQTLAGEIASARVVAFDALVIAFDGEGARATEEPRAKEATTWADATSPVEEPKRRVETPPSPGAGGIPQRIAKPVREEVEQIIPEPGDAVEHFAFGPCDVLKSDGDRLHLKVHKDQRIREIALEMLRVTPLQSDDPSRRKFRLDRKL